MTVTMCSSELVLVAISTAVLRASCASSEPSVVSRIFAGKMLTSTPSLQHTHGPNIINSIQGIALLGGCRCLYSPSCREGGCSRKAHKWPILCIYTPHPTIYIASQLKPRSVGGYVECRSEAKPPT